MKVVTSLKKVWLSHQTTAFLMSRHVLLCIVLAFWHPRILFLLPFFWIYDAFMRDYLLNVIIYRQYLRQLANDIVNAIPYTGEQGLLANIVTESNKYELNQQLDAYSQWRKREKETYIMQFSDWKKMVPTSYNCAADYNIIILPFNFDPFNILHAVVVAHEYSHAMGHDGYKLEKYSLYLSCFGTLALLFSYAVIISNPNWFVIGFGAITVFYLLISTIINSEYDKELDADIGAIRYFDNMDSFTKSKVPTRKGRTVLQEVAYDIAFIRNEKKYIKPLWPFLRADDQRKLMDRIIKMEPDKWKFNYSSTEDVYMTMYDIKTILAFLIVFITSIVCSVHLLSLITIRWYCLFGGVIPYILLMLSIIKSNKLWKKKKNLLRKNGLR